jgi:hypothetical protein
MKKEIKWGNIPIKGLKDLGDKKYSMEQLNRIEQGENAVLSGQLKSIQSKGGKIRGILHYKNGTGLFGMSDKKKKQAAINGGKSAGKLAVKKGTVIKAGKVSAKSPKHPNNTLEKCIHCGYKTTLPLIRRWHNDNCKQKNK